MYRRSLPVVLALSLALAPSALGATPLQRSVSQLRHRVAKVHHHRAVKRRARKIVIAVHRHKLCRARSASRGFRRAVRHLPRSRRTRLVAAALNVESKLLVLPGTKRCGGVSVAPVKGNSPVTKVLADSPTELKVSVSLPAVQLQSKTGGGKAFTAASMPGLSTDGAAAGAPAVPTMAQSFAIPTGATVDVTADPGSSYTLDGVDLYPTQPSPVDAGPLGPHDPLFANKPFTQDAKAYGSGSPIPLEPAAAGAVPQGQLRDLDLGQLDVAGAQYTPKAKKLEVFTQATVDIQFKGGSQTFGDGQTGSPYNAPFLKVYGNALVNGSTVLTHLHEGVIKALPCGEEMMIVTSPDLRPAADALASSRNTAGLLTRVFETGSGPGTAGTTADQIRAFAQAEIASTNCIRPSYLTLMGDTSKVPTFHGGDPGVGDIPTDFVYGEKFDGIPLPDLAVGRIPAPTLASANTMVSKITGYETSPPGAAAFYANATVTSYFQGAGPQDERGFLRTAEQLRAGLIGNGKTVTRRYAKDAGANPSTFDDGTAIPGGLSYTATNTDVVSDVNAGRFLFISRDHGYETGVSAPGWSSSDVSSMTNAAQLPVFWLIVCSAGTFDSPGSPSLAETLLRRDGGGAVGVLAASRVSPSEVNNRLSMGLADAVYPSILPYSGSSTPLRRMGDVLNAGKLHVILESASLNDFYGGSATQDIRNEQRLYNYFGDPSMQLRTSAPPLLAYLGAFQASQVHLTGLSAAAGGTVSLLQGGKVIGKAFIPGDGSVDINPDQPVGDGEVDAVVDTDGFGPSTIKVRDAAPPPPPPPPKQPDLIVTAVSSGVVSDQSQTSITVKNRGDAAAGLFQATITGTDAQTGGQTTLTVRFPDGLDAGAEQTKTVQNRILYNTLTGVADSGAQVEESDESNNTGTGQGQPHKP